MEVLRRKDTLVLVFIEVIDLLEVIVDLLYGQLPLAVGFLVQQLDFIQESALREEVGDLGQTDA